jgi:hypothetical protein
MSTAVEEHVCLIYEEFIKLETDAYVHAERSVHDLRMKARNHTKILHVILIILGIFYYENTSFEIWCSIAATFLVCAAFTENMAMAIRFPRRNDSENVIRCLRSLDKARGHDYPLL